MLSVIRLTSSSGGGRHFGLRHLRADQAAVGALGLGTVRAVALYIYAALRPNVVLSVLLDLFENSFWQTIFWIVQAMLHNARHGNPVGFICEALLGQ